MVELCLRRAVLGGAVGQVTIDIYNEATIALWADKKRNAPPPPWYFTALSLWSELAGGSVFTGPGDSTMFAVRAYAPLEERLVDGVGKTVSEQLVEAAQAGYAIPLDVALAASAAGYDGQASTSSFASHEHAAAAWNSSPWIFAPRAMPRRCRG